jgi:hypothetical protein
MVQHNSFTIILNNIQDTLSSIPSATSFMGHTVQCTCTCLAQANLILNFNTIVTNL